MEIYKINKSFPLEEKGSKNGIFSSFIDDINEWINYFTQREYESNSEFILIHRIPNQVFF